MVDIEIEEDVSMAEWIMDSFVDGQPNVQLGEPEALARVRNLVSNEVTVDPITPHFPRSMAGHQRSLHTLRVNPVMGSSQPRLVFIPQPSVSCRGAGSAPGMPPRNIFQDRQERSPCGRTTSSRRSESWVP